MWLFAGGHHLNIIFGGLEPRTLNTKKVEAGAARAKRHNYRSGFKNFWAFFRRPLKEWLKAEAFGQSIHSKHSAELFGQSIWPKYSAKALHSLKAFSWSTWPKHSAKALIYVFSQSIRLKHSSRILGLKQSAPSHWLMRFLYSEKKLNFHHLVLL